MCFSKPPWIYEKAKVIDKSKKRLDHFSGVWIDGLVELSVYTNTCGIVYDNINKATEEKTFLSRI